MSESKGRAEFDKELSTDNNGDASGECGTTVSAQNTKFMENCQQQ